MTETRPIVFVGSSILAQWTELAAHLEPLPVANRAVGGTLTQDQLDRFDTLWDDPAPSLVVYYCGSNDLKAGHDPTAVAARCLAFSDQLHIRFPEVNLVLLASLRTPDRRAYWDRVDRYNALVASHVSRLADRHIFDLNPALLDAAGEPIPDFFQEDQLHLRPAAYTALARILRPQLIALHLMMPCVTP